MKQLFSLSLLVCWSVLASAQLQIQVTIQDGTASSNCFDLFPPTDPIWEVNVANQGWVTYENGSNNCYTTTPHQAYTLTIDCPADLPAQIQLCLRAFDNDAILPCGIVRDCSESICADFAIPPPGATVDYNLTLSVPGSSSGMVNFSISTSMPAFPDNDLICNAVDLGVLAYGDTLGNVDQGLFSNICATPTNEPDPIAVGGYFSNQAGVWFRFNSGPTPSGLIVVEAFSDPQGSGDPIDLEAVVFSSDDGSCNGNLTLFSDYNFNSTTLNTRLIMYCPEPNTDYYVLVDGGLQIPDGQRGVFGLQVWDVGVQEGGDLRCQAENLGVVPDGGSVSTNGWRSNFCAGSLQDPNVPAFVSQHSVWFSFVAPASGHVIIEGISDTLKDIIGMQLAVYRSFNNTCTGFFSHVASQYTDTERDERMELTCLFAGRTYFILVDGDGGESRGIFTLTVSDAGDITPVTQLDTVLCFGESLRVGASLYTQSGQYSDTIQVFGGCDSIVNANITVLEELVPTVEQTRVAIGQGVANGEATVSATGGAGSYTFLWCTGETGPTATALVGGETCCVTVTDAQGCTAELCFTVAFATPIIPTFQNDTLLCNGDSDGVIQFSVAEGIPPYNYTWQNANNSLNGGGSITAANELVVIPNLPAGAYQVSVNDILFDTTFTIRVEQPEPLLISLDNQTQASCFGFCDGSLRVAVSGGVMPYAYSWSNGGATAEITNLCAAPYRLTVTDANGCIATFDTGISEPPEFIASAQLVQEVSCFGGADGSVTVTTNGNPVGWQWSNQGATATLANLPTGFYDVTVTNADGCEAYASVAVPQPAAPLQVAITELDPISCFDATDGRLGAEVAGPFTSLTYAWSNGANQAEAVGLANGVYSLIVTNEKGCQAEAQYSLLEPAALEARLRITDINCVDGDDAGAILVDSTFGGRPGYTYALNDQSLGTTPLWEGLTEGAYTVTVRDAAGCTLTLPASVLGPPELLVNLGDDETLYLGDSLELLALTNSSDVVFTWSHDAALRSEYATVRPLESGFYRVIAFDSVTLCQAEDIMRITVDRNRRVFIPNVFSPNGDGQNDRFFIHAGNDVTGIATFRIFSRTGQLVFERKNVAPNDPFEGWDGLFRGQPLNPGVFVYVAEIEFFDGRTEVFKGDVALMR